MNKLTNFPDSQSVSINIKNIGTTPESKINLIVSLSPSLTKAPVQNFLSKIVRFYTNIFYYMYLKVLIYKLISKKNKT